MRWYTMQLCESEHKILITLKYPLVAIYDANLNIPCRAGSPSEIYSHIAVFLRWFQAISQTDGAADLKLSHAKSYYVTRRVYS